MPTKTIRGITPRPTETEQPETVVIFRVWKDDGSVIALFVEVPADLQGKFCNSYEHIGQHSGADFNGVCEGTRPATPAEFASLKRELESNPYCYRLKVLDEANEQNHDMRRKNAQDMRTRMSR
jgi:hypothetical protein